MRKPLNATLALSAMIALASCASKDNANTSAAAVTAACPEINGQYRADINSSTIEASVQTRIENGKYSYNLDAEGGAPWLEADGVERTFTSEDGDGKARATCSGNAVEFRIHPNGEAPFTLKYTLLSPTELKVQQVEESGEISADATFTKI